MTFAGFNAQDDRTAIPDAFFRELLPQIDHPQELKLVLYVLWRVMHQERPVPFVTRGEIAADYAFMDGLAGDEAALDDALNRAVERNVLLQGSEVYLLNSPKGRAALKGLEAGKWSADTYETSTIKLQESRPNIFALYEMNIGPLTPMIAESLREAEAQYPAEWIEDAVRIALENNVRKWRYVEAILKSWQEKGRNERRDQQDSEEDRRKYVEGEFSDFIER